MSARASGSDAKDDSGGAKNRAHHDGSSSRSYTVEQKTAVIRIRKCSPTAFYDILGLEEVRTTCSEGEIKKAYRKLSLLTHPDKNGYDGADEAFKMVSKAFQILSDSDKKSKYDKFGGDPDSRHSAASASSPFGRASAAGGDWSRFNEEEMSPEELFRQFFGGGVGGFPGFAFDTGPQFVFNVGGPGIRIHQFGGGGPRRRPAGGDPRVPQDSTTSMIATILPVLLLFFIPLLTSFLSGLGGSSAGPRFEFEKTPSVYLTKKFTTDRYNVDYWVNPNEVKDLSRNQRRNLDERAEVRKVSELRHGCSVEQSRQQQLYDEAQGWFSVDQAKMKRAKNMKLDNCDALRDMEKRAMRNTW